MVTCESCGASLPSPDAVCAQCEPQLSRPDETGVAGKFRCPNCTLRFDQPTKVQWPQNARWYVPQQVKQQCPHCKVLVRESNFRPFSALDVFIVLVLALLARVCIPHPYTSAAVLFMLLGYIGLRFIWLARKKPMEKRYECE